MYVLGQRFNNDLLNKKSLKSNDWSRSWTAWQTDRHGFVM